MSFAKPWEQGAEQAEREAQADLTKKPWDPDIPDVPGNVAAQQRHREAIAMEGKPIDKIKAQAFAKEYLRDFDGVKALIRAGLAPNTDSVEYLVRTAAKYCRNIHVLQALQAFVARIEDDKIVTRERVLMGLYEEANYRGLGSTQSARVAAWAKLAKLLGMEDGDKPDPLATTRGGVMLVPLAGGVDAWERAAIGQQQRLKAEVRA